MRVSTELLMALGARQTDAMRHVEALAPLMLLHAIDTPLRIAHFLAQVMHESSHLARVVENMNYSAEGLMRIFPRHFRDITLARDYARKPERIGNRAYAGRMGNGDEASGDGYRYRGRGFIQLTGKSNYREFSSWVGDDVVSEPDRVAELYPAHSAVFFWSTRKLNRFADLDDLVTITRRINGGLNGFDDRKCLLELAKEWFEDAGESVVVPDATPEIFEPTHRVGVKWLNLRSAPRVSPTTWIATLSQSAPVQVLEDVTREWVRVRARVGNSVREGLVAARYLLSEPPDTGSGEEPRPAAPPASACDEP